MSTERKALPGVDLASSVGGTDAGALEMSQQQVDEATMLSVVSQ